MGIKLSKQGKKVGQPTQLKLLADALRDAGWTQMRPGRWFRDRYEVATGFVAGEITFELHEGEGRAKKLVEKYRGPSLIVWMHQPSVAHWNQGALRALRSNFRHNAMIAGLGRTY